MSIAQLASLGESLVKCSLHCAGVTNRPDEYVIPRTLNLEQRKGTRRCAVVGINPGHCDESERGYYRTRGITYSSVAGYFKDTINRKSLFKRTKELIEILGYDGDILWTNLVKCESAGKNRLPPPQTRRVCTNRFLRQEMELFECDTIVTLGRDPFNYAALFFPRHLVIGLPHPTGGIRGPKGYGVLSANVKRNGVYYQETLSHSEDVDGNKLAIHLSDIVPPPR